MWQFRDKKDLLAVAFIDAETYIHSAKSLRGLIVVSDVNRSVQLLQYQVHVLLNEKVLKIICLSFK